MIGQSFVDEMDCGNFFDNMDDLIDFPNEDMDLGFGIGDNDMFPSIWSPQPESWPASDPLFSSKSSNSETSTELYVPFENIVQLEQPSGFVDDSFSDKKADSSSMNTDSLSSHSQFRSSSPVSVLESSSSSSQTTTCVEPIIIPGKHGRPRTKRPRPVAQELNDDKERDKESFSGVCAAESRLVIRIPKHLLSEHNKKKKKKAKVSPSFSGLSQDGNENHDYSSSEQHVRKCMHCEVTKTPQWRLGPMGPKTLCNACGVRYKSGRLFPEYRPAASPTFTPALHSNSHKKVVEMRSMKSNGGSGNAIDNDEDGNNDLQELIPNNNNHIATDYV